MTTRLATVAALMVVALTPKPALAQTTPANLYECSGNNGLIVTYSTTSFTGDPRFFIKIDGVTISRSGDEIGTQATVLGNLVTIVRRQVPDLFTDTITLVAPDVNVTDKEPSVEFNTTLFLTRTHTTIGGPSLVVGVIQESTTRRLVCRASSVAF